MGATSDRLRWAELPGEVTEEIARVLGSPVTDARDQRTGFSPGLAARVGTADGRRAFVKAAPDSLGAAASLYRREARVLRLLPDGLPVPRLLGTVDTGEWFGLVAEEVDGRHPAGPGGESDEPAARSDASISPAGRSASPPSTTDVEAVLDVVAAAPRIADSGLPSLTDEIAVDGWAVLASGHDDRLSPFEREQATTLDRLSREALAHLHGDRLVHLDTRSDNVLLDAAGTVWLVDWAWACVGAPWIDGLSMLLDARMAGARDSERMLGHPAFADVPAEGVDALLAALAGTFRLSSLQPPPPRMGALRGFQAREADAALDWLAERWRHRG
ncbi:phosphotransferase family protein [Leifsonia sp. AG29]|uniref:phosphotransferase family protein n=1 Tax=Leifsonia sp. AG29 TaxID=2598860 RepID=UPI00131ACAC9|nr:phosphotransferase [Leifsonia sp. AG29]